MQWNNDRLRSLIYIYYSKLINNEVCWTSGSTYHSRMEKAVHSVWGKKKNSLNLLYFLCHPFSWSGQKWKLLIALRQTKVHLQDTISLNLSIIWLVLMYIVLQLVCHIRSILGIPLNNWPIDKKRWSIGKRGLLKKEVMVFNSPFNNILDIYLCGQFYWCRKETVGPGGNHASICRKSPTNFIT